MKRKILLILLVMMPLMLISCQNRQNRITEKVVSAIQNGDTERAKELIMTDGYDVNTPTFLKANSELCSKLFRPMRS